MNNAQEVKVISMAVVMAVYNRDWTKDTSFDEMYDDFDGIIVEANQHLKDAGVDYTITANDVAVILWDEDLEDLVAE
jgi:hypothetical protein